MLIEVSGAYVTPRATHMGSVKRRPNPLWIASLTLCAFGPYLSESIGVRTEQPAFLLVAFLMLPILLDIRIPRRALCVATCLGGVLVVGVIAAALPAHITLPNVHSGSLLAGLVNNLMPVAGVVIALVWLRQGYTRETIFRTVATVVVWVMSLNTLVALAQSRTDLTGILHHFWQATPVVNLSNSVALRSITNGRYTGIFDQPAQAGILYGLAILFAVYLYAGRSRNRLLLFVVLASLVTVGGFLTVSKVFILGGFPLALMLLLGRWPGRKARLVVVVLLGIVVIVTGVVAHFSGSGQLAQLFHPPASGGYIGLFTGGRLSSGRGSLLRGFAVVASVSPVLGFGLAGTTAPVDSAWLSVAVTAGVVGVILYVLASAMLVAGYVRTRAELRVKGVALAVLLLVLGSTVGFPIYTGNRISGLLWVVLTVLFLVDQPWNDEADAPNTCRRLHSVVV